MSNSRQILLYVLVGGVAIYFGGEYLLNTYVETPLKQKQQRKDSLEKDLKKAQKKRAESKAAIKRLDVMEKYSLPTDSEVARSLYRTWLTELAEKSRFQTAHVDSGPVTNRKGAFESLAFSVRGRATFNHVVRFLYDFYHAGHLHRIQSMNLTPSGKDGSLEVVMAIEALILPGCSRKDQLSSLTSSRLKHDSLTDYSVIAQRNFFGIGGEINPSGQAYLTAVIRDRGEPEIWITIRGQDKLLKLHEGSSFDIGPVTGTVVEIFDDDIVYESAGERWLLSVGEPISEAIPVPSEL